MMEVYADRNRAENLAKEFKVHFSAPAELFFSSPGRAEIVGNHTDHNLGKVLVSAISCDILCACAPRTDGVVEIVSEGFSPIRFSVHDLGRREREKGKSIALARGVMFELSRRGYPLSGFSAVTNSTVFRGAGVSSSAAFEVLVAEIVNVIAAGGRISPIEKARAAQFAENTYFGKPCGMLDQSGIAFGGLNKIDFFSEGDPIVERVPAPEGLKIVLTNTGGSHAALTAHYADIRREMGEVAALFGKRCLREVPYSQFKERLPVLRKHTSDRAILRAWHFFEENARVDRAADALKTGDTAAFLMQVQSSGESSLAFLQNCFVPGDTFEPLVVAYKLSQTLPCAAFRMMGGGFAGALIAFCREGTEEAYGRQMARVFGRENVYYTQMRESGASQVNF